MDSPEAIKTLDPPCGGSMVQVTIAGPPLADMCQVVADTNSSQTKDVSLGAAVGGSWRTLADGSRGIRHRRYMADAMKNGGPIGRRCRLSKEWRWLNSWRTYGGRLQPLYNGKYTKQTKA